MWRFLVVIVLSGMTCRADAQQGNDSLITLLRAEIDQKNIYVQQKLDRIDKLRAHLAGYEQLNLTARFELYNSLYHEYKTFIYDSAFNYARKLIDISYGLNDKSKVGYARIKLGFILISSGMFKETFDSLKVVEVKYLSDSSRVDYYRLISRAYSDLNIYNKDRYYRNSYTQLDTLYLDSALLWCKPDSYNDYYLSAVKYLHANDYQGTISTVEKLLKQHRLTNPQLAVNYYDVGNAYKALNDEANTIKYTALSSISDIRAATKETAAMHTLAKYLFEKGDTENAYVFIQQALDDAEFYGARQRKVEISSILPLIAAAQLTNANEQRRIWIVYSTTLTILVSLVIAFAVIIFKQLKKLKAAESTITKTNAALQDMNQKLIEADKIKEEYIGYYFRINSDYIDKIESFRNAVDKKLTAKKADDIRHIVNNIHPSREREELYFNFDQVFLKLFPDFINTFNSYFNTEDRIIPKDGHLLNTELRIFALIRMGIHDAEKIARILGYSVNTIYAYKNRVKSKSLLPNEEFEQRIMEIMTVPAVKS